MNRRVPIGRVNRIWPAMVTRLGVSLTLFAFLLILFSPAGRAERGEPKRVLMLHSFGRDFEPWNEYARTIRAELERQSPWPLDVQEHTLLTARFNNPGPEAPFVEYLRSLHSVHRPDIVLSIGAPAANFIQKY